MGALIEVLMTLLAELNILTSDPTRKPKGGGRSRSVTVLVLLVLISLLVTFGFVFFPQLREHLPSLQ